MRYGLPYMGSKNSIARWVVEHIPSADVFVDLFAGGCAVTHAALLSGRFGRIIANDITDAPQLFRDAVEGKFTDERRWISRDDFFKLKDSDPYVRYCWSFGNGGRTYLYSKEVEPWKRAVHYARVFGDVSLLRAFGIDSDGFIADIRAHHEDYKKKYIAWYVKHDILDESDYKKLLDDLTGNIRRESDKLRAYLVDGLKKSGKSLQSLQSLERLQRLQRLQSLERLQSLQRLQRLQTVRGDYRAVKIPAGSVVYCDIPYIGTQGYNGETFDHEEFYAWAERQSVLVLISEYTMPEDRFVRIASVEKCQLLCSGNGALVSEGLFVPRGQAHRIIGDLFSDEGGI